MSVTKPEILIIGAGAVGLSLAAKLSDNACVSVVCRKRHLDAICTKGLLIEGEWGDKRIGNLKCFSRTKELRDSGILYDFIMITSKSTDTADICEKYNEILKNHTVISVQNGIGNEDIINKYSKMVLGATITTNFRVTGNGSVTVRSESEPMKVGVYPDNSYEDQTNVTKLENVIRILNLSGIRAEKCTDIRSAIWEKSLLNIAVNPISAIFSVPVGEMADENLRTVISEVINEVFLVLKAEKINIRWDNPKDYLDYFFSYLIPSFSNVFTSMQQDIEMNRPTEIDFINGTVVKIAQKHCIDVPFNSCRCSFIKYREKVGSLSQCTPG